MFERPHHQRIASVLWMLDGDLLLRHGCFFGGGTAIALCYGEYRESVDIDFLVSDLDSYRQLRLLTTSHEGISALCRPHVGRLKQMRDVRADQYGIRTMLLVADQPIKFEIVLEGRIKLQRDGNENKICGISVLSPLDMVASKLLANSDRWGDEGVFNRDLIDLAMMRPGKDLLQSALSKAELAYGSAVIADLCKAVEKFRHRKDWLDRCTLALDVRIPKALLWERIRSLRRMVGEL